MSRTTRERARSRRRGHVAATRAPATQVATVAIAMEPIEPIEPIEVGVADAPQPEASLPPASQEALATESASAAAESAATVAIAVAEAADPLGDDESALPETPSQPSQPTAKLPTLAIMATVTRRPSLGNASDPRAATPSASESDPRASSLFPPRSAQPTPTVPTLPALPPVPETLKERLRAQVTPEDSSTSSQDSGVEALSRLAARADDARSALRDTVRRQRSGETQAARQNAGSHADPDLDLEAADAHEAQHTRPIPTIPPALPQGDGAHAGHRPLPEIDPLPLLTTLHAGIGAVAALTAAVLLVVHSPLALLVLALAGLAGGSSMLASLRGWTPPRRRFTGAVLLGSELAMLAWALLVVGPRASLLFLVPAMAVWALRVLGRGALSVIFAGALVLYGSAAVLLVSGPLTPALALGAAPGTAFDGTLAALGLALTLGGMDRLIRLTLKARARARAREIDVAYLRERLGKLERAVASEAETVRTTLRRSVRLRRALPLSGEGPFADIYPSVNTAMERVATLARDREERLRLEGAVRQLTQAVEKSWLGQPWTWPEESGTLLDDLVALLRSPSPRARALPMDVSASDAPLTPVPWPLIPIPSVEVERARLRRAGEPVRADTRYTLPELEPPRTGASSPRWTPWDTGD